MASWSENFDGVTAPSLPSTISVDGGSVITSTTIKRSGSNAVKHTPVDSSIEFHSVSSGCGADAILTAAFNMSQIGSFTGAFFGVRRQSGSGSGYFAQIKQGAEDAFDGSATPGIKLYKRSGGVGGTYTAIGSLVAVNLTANVWYVCKIVPSGTTIKVRLQRDSDSNWLNSSGSWVSGETDAISQTDATYSAAGEAMVSLYQSQFHSPGTSDTVYVDDMTYADPVSGTYSGDPLI